MSEQVKLELEQYLTKYDDDSWYNEYGFRRAGKYVYKKIFMEPVKQLFYWQEEDWQGSTFAVYEYKKKLVVVRGYFGSCSGCDAFEGSTREEVNERLHETVRRAEIYDDVRMIELSKYSHPELRQAFEKFRQEFVENHF